MISEEQLQKLEHLVKMFGNAEYRLDKNTCDSDMQYMVDCTNAVPALIAEVRSLQKMLHVVSDTSNKILDNNNQLEKEADYLAEIVASIHGCCVDGVEGDCDKKPDPFYEIPCVRCWREAARKAVQDETV